MDDSADIVRTPDPIEPNVDSIMETVQLPCQQCGELVEWKRQVLTFGGRPFRQPTGAVFCSDHCEAAAVAKREAEAQRRAEVEAMMRREQLRRERESIGGMIWPRYRSATPNDLLPQLAALPPDASVILSGPTGTGKTFQAWALWLRWALANTTLVGTAPQVFTAADLLESLRRSFDGEPVNLSDALLIIDDLGAEKPSEWVVEQLYRIIDHRYRNCLPLVVTTNLGAVQLRERIGDRSVSRLLEMCEVVKMDGTDRRTEARKARKGVK